VLYLLFLAEIKYLNEGLTEIYRSIPKFDDRCAQEEWGWQPEYDHERMIDDFIADLNQHPDRYT
jgi:nucleoside-diphosphate-sugar epimerase